MSIDPRDVDICIHSDTDLSLGPSATTPPIVQTALFAHRSFDELIAGLGAEDRHHVYTRGCNPTVEALEHKIAALERGEACAPFRPGCGNTGTTPWPSPDGSSVTRKFDVSIIRDCHRHSRLKTGNSPALRAYSASS